MFGFGKTKEEKIRDTFRSQFLSLVRDASKGNQQVRGHLGMAIMSAYELFTSSYTDAADFASRPVEEKTRFIHMYAALENKIAFEQEDGLGSVGFGLVGMWLQAVANKDQELIALFSEQLKAFTFGGPPSR